MDLIIRRAQLPRRAAQLAPPHPQAVDIGIEAGRIVAVEPNLAASAHDEIDACGSLVTPPFVDPHFHMDATLSYGLPRCSKASRYGAS
jgi:cytosine/creatinine deaminase